MNIITYSSIAIISYFIGATPWGYIIAKSKGIDIRKEGSGNVGATNVLRTLGKKYGIACFFLDFLKGFLPVIAITLLKEHDILNLSTYAIILASFCTIFGHMWPIYLKFKGGKGVSTIGGILLAIAPLSFIFGGTLWLIVFYSSRYVSLASILASLSLPISAFLFDKFDIFELPTILIVMLFIISLLITVKHLGNIKRLINGTENRFTKIQKIKSTKYTESGWKV